jgi:hypothetical protein
VEAKGLESAGLRDFADALQIVVDSGTFENPDAAVLGERAVGKLRRASRLAATWRSAALREARRTGVRAPAGLRDD